MLTPKQRRFVEEYIVDLNATQAAIRADYSPRSAVVGSLVPNTSNRIRRLAAQLDSAPLSASPAAIREAVRAIRLRNLFASTSTRFTSI